METRSDIASKYRIIARRLAALRISWRLNAAAQGIMLAAIAALPLVAAGALIGARDYPRAILLALSAAAAVFLLLYRAIFPLLRPLGLKDLSLLAERRNPGLENKLTTAVELWRREENHSELYNPALLSALYDEAASASASTKIRRVLDLRRTARLAAAAALISAVFAVVLAASPGAASRFVRFVAPPYFPKPDSYAIEWVSGNRLIQIGAPVTIAARLSGNVTGAPTVIIEREGLEAVRMPMRRTRALNFAVTLPSVNGDTAYTVIYGRARSGPWRITTIEPPRVQNLRIKLVYPKYSGMPPEERENAGDILALFGTVVQVEVASSSPLRGAFLSFGKTKVPLSIKGDSLAAGSFRVENDAAYSIRLVDMHRFANLMPPSYTVRSVPDAPPQVELTQPQSDITLPGPAILLLRGSARDDYGISSVALHYKITTSNKSGTIRIPVQPGPDVTFELPWDLSRSGAIEGDEIEYFLSAADNDPFNGPKSARTPPLKISVMSERKQYEQIDRENDKIISRLESTVGEARNISQAFKNLSQNLSTSKAADWQKNTDVQRAVDRQQSLEQELSDISSKMQDNLSHMQQNDLVSFDTLQKMNQIQQMMDQILTKEMRALIEKIQKNVRNVDISKLDRALLESMKDQEKLLRNLENTLQRLKRIRAEQKLDALAKQTKELSDRQKQVLDETAPLKQKQAKSGLDNRDRQNLDRLSREEKQIKDDLADTRDKLDDLKKDLGETSPETADDLEKALRDLANAKPDDNLDEASDNLQSQRLHSAARNEQNAYEAMLTLSGKMKGMNKNYSSQMSEAMRRMIMHALYKTLNLSDVQEKTMDRTSGLAARPGARFTPSDSESVTSELRFQRDVITELASDLTQLSGLSMTVPPDLVGDALNAASELNAAMDDVKENRPPDAFNSISNSFIELNRISLALLDAQSGGQGSGKGELEAFMSQLQSLADSQESLNSLTQQIGSSGLPIPQMTGALQSLAAQQQAIKEGVSKLMKDAEGMGEYGKRLGQIQQAMEEIRKELAGGHAGDVVQRRQSDVLRRLKDATLSLKKEVLEEKRVAETGKEYAPVSPAAAKAASASGLPQKIILEMNTLRKESKLKGYENAIENYYRSITAPK